MKKPKHELMTFVAGIVMLVAGLFILSQKVIVSSSFFSSFGGLSIWGARVSSGMVVIPLIIGIVWMFMTDSFASKVFSALAGLLIVIAVILSTNIHLTSMTLFDPFRCRSVLRLLHVQVFPALCIILPQEQILLHILSCFVFSFCPPFIAVRNRIPPIPVYTLIYYKLPVIQPLGITGNVIMFPVVIPWAYFCVIF